jgi:hypothetical protein
MALGDVTKIGTLPLARLSVPGKSRDESRLHVS